MSKTDIELLRHDMPFSDSAAIILKQKYNDSRKKVRIFLEDSSVENLHSLRIAVRRLRYSLENFKVCYSKKSFKQNIKYLKSLQDLIGVGRDLDMLKENMDNISAECKIIIPREFYECLTDKKSRSMQEIKLEFLKFLHNKDVRNFFTGKKED